MGRTGMTAFQTLLNRNMWMNPLSDVMGGWWIWKTTSDGTVTLTTECFGNVVLMLPLTALLCWTYHRELLGDKIVPASDIGFGISMCIEMLQLFLRLGTWQLSDLVYNTLGGILGGMLYWCLYHLKHLRSSG